jgi:hypothetical protein
MRKLSPILALYGVVACGSTASSPSITNGLDSGSPLENDASTVSPGEASADADSGSSPSPEAGGSFDATTPDSSAVADSGPAGDAEAGGGPDAADSSESTSYDSGFAHPVISVDASSVLHTIPRDIFGINMAAWTGLNNSGEATYEERMKVAGVTQVRWPGGSWGDILDWSDIQCEGSSDATTEQAISFMSTFGGKMEPIVNFSGFWCSTQHTHAQAVSLAASWVTYMNVTNSYATKIWEVGNEVYGSWAQGYTNGTTYGSDYADYYQAMKAVDPSIEIGAVVLPSATDTSDFTPDVLKAAKAKGVTPDFFIIHEYPYSGTTAGASADAAILANVGQVAGWTSSLNQIVSDTYGASTVGKIAYRMTEYSGPLSPTVATVEYVQAMFAAQFMMELAAQGWSGANLWAAKNGAESGGGDWGFLDASNDPHPDYYVFPILAGKFGSSQVSAKSTNSSVRSYAAMDASGNLTLFLVNNSPSTDVAATVAVAGFRPAATGTKWVLLPAGNAPSGAPQEAPSLQINGIVNPAPASLPALAGVSQPGASGFTVDLPPSAMVLVVMPPG